MTINIVALVGIMICMETGGRESRLHGAVRHMKREALKLAVGCVGCCACSVRKLEQGTYCSPTRGRPADPRKAKPVCFGGQGQRPCQQAGGLRLAQPGHKTVDPAGEIKRKTNGDIDGIIPYEANNNTLTLLKYSTVL
jgi:hypothetical protein